ncbi:MAG: InlB B-repeat-containing protein [Paludibacteraceae bacterium]|nr:InlB B-repeat-containing protein [Paludibacteraceae bacterium]
MNSTTNGKIRVDYYNTSGTSTYWEGSSGTSLTVPQSAIITVTAIGNTGYNVNTLSVGGSAFTSGSTYTVTAATTISATFVAKPYSISLDRQQGSSGSTSVTMTYNSSSHTSITAPTAPTGYTFAGWYTGALGTGSMVMNASGVLQANVTNFTGAGGIWTKDGTCTLYAKYTASYPDGYLYITDVKSNPETKAGYTITSSVSSAAFNGSMGDDFASNHSGYQYWSRTTGSGSTTLSFSGNLAASATAGGLTIDVWWGAEDNRSTTIKLNGGDAVALDAVPDSKARYAVRKATYNTEMKSLSSIQLLCGSAKAVWFRIGVKERPGYLLTYDDGDGSGAPSAEYKPNATITLSSTIPTYAGHMFAGWQVNGAGAIYAPGATFDMPAEATTLVAKWEENCYQGTITKSSGNLTASHGGETSLTASDATITSGGGIKIVNTTTGSGSVNYACSSDGMNINTTNGYIEFTLPSGSVLATGSIIRVQGKTGNNSYGLKIIDDSGNEIAKQTNNGAIDFTYTVTSQSAINGNDHVRINRVTNNGTTIKAVTVAGCGSVSCYTPAEPTISGTADYIVGQTLTLTADISGSNHDASTTYTWYKGANWATASESSPVQAAAVAGSNGHIFTKTAAVGDAGTYWCEASNGTGCESHNSTGKAVTVVYKVTYAANGGTGDAMANTTGTSITLSSNGYTAPSGYTFDGWRTVSDKQASGTDYAAGTSGITANLDLYAMWKQTVTLDDNGGTKDGSAVVYYNASSASTPTAPTYSGYTADGYYAEPGCTNLVMSTAGALTNYTGYVSGSKWVHSGATTLYAHYKCTAPTITCTDNVVTMSTTSTGATIYYTYTTDGSTPSDPTSSNDAYDPEDKPVITKNTQFKAIAIESGKTNSAVTSQSCTYTAFSSSVNIEQTVLDGGMIAGVKSALDAANITYLNSGLSVDTLNDEPSKGVYKVLRNEPYLGLKIKNEGTWVQVTVPAGSTLKVKFGHIDDALGLSINSEAQDNISAATNGYVYELDAALTPQVVKFTTTTGDAVVIKQIMVGKSLESITLPAKITLGATTNGTISVDNTKVNVGSTVAITVTPSSGYELDELTVTRDTIGSPSVSVTDNEFTMPNNNVTINATFVLSGHSVTAATSAGADTYGTVSAAAATVAEGGTTLITAVPATGYKVTNWAVSGTGASITPSGESNSNTSTLTMGSADATVTVTFGPKTYTLTLDKNGGSADGTATATYNQYSLASITDATCALTHYSLGGYYTAADGGVLLVTASGSPRNLSAEDASHDAELATWLSPYTGRNWIYDDDITLYAHWWTSLFLNPNTEYHGTGTTRSAKAIYNGSALEDLQSTTGEDGYTLMGYYTTPDGGTKVLNADGTFAAENISGYISGGKWIYSGASFVTLYAHWAQLYTVTYDGNGKTSGTVPSAIEDQSFGTEITVAGNTGTLAKTGFTFVGWNTADDGSGSFYAVGSKFTLTGNITLYAQWADCGGGSPTNITIFDGTISTNPAPNADNGTAGLTYKKNHTYTDATTKFQHTLTGIKDALVDISEATYTNKGDYLNGIKWGGSSTSYYATYVVPTGYTASISVTYVLTSGATKYIGFGTTKSAQPNGSNFDTNVSITSNNVVETKTFSSLAAGTYYFLCSGGDATYILAMSAVVTPTSGSCTTYDVSFADMTGFAGTSTLPDDISDVYDGATIAEPVIPTATGYVFGGWYKEGACTNKWNFATDVVDDDITLYAKWVDVSGKYTFHYGGGEASDNTWMIIPFTQEGTSSYYNIEDFIVPNTAKYPSFFVGYEGKYDTENAKSAIYEWDATYGSEPASGRMPIRHNEALNQSNCPLSADGQMADGAKGNLRIFVYGDLSTNCYVGFYPSGFALDWERGTTVLHSTTNPKVFETDVVTLTAAEAAGNFEVKLATNDANEFVAYGRTATETAEGQLNDRKVAGESYDIAAGTVGRFQINLSKKDNNFGLRFVPLVNRTTTSGNWETDDNWTLWRRPNIKETAYVAHSTTIKTPTAQVKNVIVDKTSGVGYPKLYIDSDNDGVGGLLVENHIQVLKMVDETPTLSDETTYSELEINSSADGSGALIMGDASTTTAAYTVLYTKAIRDAFGWVNQYVGTPSANGSIYDFYGSYLYVFSPTTGGWVQANRQPSYVMPTFKAYNLMRNEPFAGTYSFYDPLVFPGITGDDKLKVLTCDDEDEETSAEDNRIGAYMFANSWTAPIDVKAMEESDFDGSEATIYIFNAGSPAQAEDADVPSSSAVDPGQWVSIPVEAAPYLPENLTVIPSMQAFRINTTAAKASLTLDYKKHVYDPALNRADGIEIKPLRAPKHNDARPNIMRFFVEAPSGYKDNMYLFEREDFMETFDNGWDGRKVFGVSNAPQIYGINGDLKTAINAISDLEGQQVGFKTGTADSEYTITFNYEGDDTWYFNDTKEQEATLISNDAEYTFTTESDENTARFYISATPIQKVATGVENVQGNDVETNKVHKVLINDHIYIILDGKMYDATGKKIK